MSDSGGEDFRTAMALSMEESSPVTQKDDPTTPMDLTTDEDEDLKRALAMSMEDTGPINPKDNASPGDNPHPKDNPAPIDLTSDSDDDDLKRAIALSMLDEQHHLETEKEKAIRNETSSDDEIHGEVDLDAPVTVRNSSTAKPKDQEQHSDPLKDFPMNLGSTKRDLSHLSSPTSQSAKKMKMDSSSTNAQGQGVKLGSFDAKNHEKGKTVSASGSSSVLGGLNRAQLEKERLERVAARNSASASASQTMPIQSKPQNNQPGRSSHTSQINTTKPTPTSTVRPNPTSQTQNAPITLGIQFPDGVVKKTWVRGCPRLGDDITIEEVLQAEDLEMAVLSSFLVDPGWVMSKIGDETKIIMVLHSKDKDEQAVLTSQSEANYKFAFPKLEGQVNCMHSKLQLLAHPTHLRIVVPSANLMPWDWGETGVMENICFLIDLPRLPSGQTKVPATQFGIELKHFLGASGLSQGSINSLNKFDFSRTAQLGFVHTIGGSHYGNEWKRTGYCGLGTAVRHLGLATDEALKIDFVTASIGSFTEQFVKCMVLAGKGDDGSTEFGWRTNRDKVPSDVERKLSDEVKKGCRIYFPTHETVSQSRGGVNNAGTICFQAKWFDNPTFPRALMRDCRSVREGILMHDKIMFVRPDNPSGKSWAYIGSANLSESAWGKLVKDAKTKQPKLNCRNWECGVVFPVPASLAESASQEVGSKVARSLSSVREGLDRGLEDMGETEGMEVFQGYVPVPLVVPGQEYGERRPWFYRG